MAMNRPPPISSALSWILTAFCCLFPLMAADEMITRTYIVHMDKSAMPTAFADPHFWYTATLSKATTGRDVVPLSGAVSAGQHVPQLIYVYTNAIDGFSARLTASQLERLKASPGFLSAYPDLRLKLATTRTPDFLGLTPSAGIWSKTNRGEGAIIGVIDTGIWPESPSFRDDGMPPVPSRWRGACVPGENFTAAMCNRKLIGARYFNKALRVDPPDFITIDDSPRDKFGHGTHVAAVAAGNFVKGASYFGYATGVARGVAPRAHLAVYRVSWWDTPSGFSSADVLAAIDQAIADGVDVINLSLDVGGVPVYQNPVAIAAFSAMEKGIFVSTAAGNYGYYKSVYLGVPWALSVGESTIDRQLAGTVVLGDGTTINGGSLYIGEPKSTGQLPVAFQLDCQNDTDLRLHHKHGIVVCTDTSGEASYLVDLEIGVRDAQIAGAIFSSSAGLMPGFVKFGFPATFVDVDEGRRILDYINKTANPTASLQFRNTVTGTRAPAVSASSSRGPSRNCPDVLKPDLVAPGTLVLAAYLNGSSFNIISGTSVACPHAAGVAAMLKILHPDWSPAAILSALVTTANPMDNTGRPIVDLSRGGQANPLTMGSGQLNPNAALDPGLVYDAGVDDYLSFLCAMNFTEEQIRTIIRSKTQVDCPGAPSPPDLNYPSFIGFFDPDDVSSAPGKRVVREFHRTVTNVADGAWTYTANHTKMDGFSVSVKPRRLVFKQKHEKQSFTLQIVGHRKLSSFDVISGSLNWVDDRGKHVVRSPIVATVHDLLPDDDD